MIGTTNSFRDFEHAGWSQSGVCREYDKHFGTVTIQSVPALLEFAQVVAGVRVLDVCCGAGYAAGRAAELGADVIGVDFSDSQVQLAAARYPKALFQTGDATALEFDDSSFDAVVCGIGIPHLESPDAAIAEAFRVLRRGGRFAFSVYARPELAVGFGLIYAAVQAHGSMDLELPSGPNFFLFSDPNESETRLSQAGFRRATFQTVEQSWHFRSADDLFAAVINGSVRASATLRGQEEAALEKIKAMVESEIATYWTGSEFQIPMPVVIASAVKP